MVGLIGGTACSFVFIIDDWNDSTPQKRASVIIAFLPITSMLIMLGIPSLRNHFCGWMNHLPFNRWKLLIMPSIMTLAYFISRILQYHYDPLMVAVVFFVGFLTTATLREHQSDSDFTWIDASMWLLVYMPLNLRWQIWDFQENSELDKMWWSLSMSIVLIVGWGCLRPTVGVGFSWIPKIKDIIVFAIVVIIIVTAAIPLAFLTDLVHTPSSYDFGISFFQWLQCFLAIAIPEELLFRAILLHGLIKVTKKDYMSLLLSSVIYSIIGWPEEMDNLLHRFYYCLYGFATGMVFGAAYLRSGQILPGAVAHSLLIMFLMYFVPDVPKIT